MSARALAADSRFGTPVAASLNGIVLPFPHKLLWPNGSMGTPRSRAAVAKKAKADAMWATKAATVRIGGSPIPVHITVCPKARGPLPDRDNVVAAAKAYLDGIAAALSVNDRHFAAPTVTFSPERSGQFIITVGETECQQST